MNTNIESKDQISNEKYLKEFKLYLDKHTRCIFSARFGDGKSTFLSEFIEQNKNEYLFIPIYPVNYQVADNKDIFEYIKRDILIRLLMTEGVEIDNTKEKIYTQLGSFFMDNKYSLLVDLLQFIPKLNLLGIELDLGKIGKSLEKIAKQFKDYNKNNKSEQEIINDFISASNNTKGSIYEYDLISELIYDINLKYKEKFKKKIVLIIEDLDRIDPAHLFRILNIFSAHFDDYNPSVMPVEQKSDIKKQKSDIKNKFFFDKIITVCDYDNVEKIFSHFYGPNTDFSGYIHKFSAGLPFRYSLENMFEQFILDNINPSLRKYELICSTIVQEILARRRKEIVNNGILNFKDIYSLRSIQNTLRSEVLVESIILNVCDGKREINTLNDFTILLDILNKLEISLSIIKFDNSDSCKEEFSNLLYPSFLAYETDKLKYRIDDGEKLNYIKGSQGINLSSIFEATYNTEDVATNHYREWRNLIFENLSEIETIFKPYIINSIKE